MIEQFLKFGSDAIENKFYSSKKDINVNNVDIEEILVPNEFAYGKNKETCRKTRPLFITLLQISGHLSVLKNPTAFLSSVKWGHLGHLDSTPNKHNFLYQSYGVIWDTLN